MTKDQKDLLQKWGKLWSVLEKCNCWEKFRDGEKNPVLKKAYDFITKTKDYPDLKALLAEIEWVKDFDSAQMSAIKSLAADISRKELKMKRAEELKNVKATVEEVKAKLAQAGVQVSNGKVNKKAALEALSAAEKEPQYCKILAELSLDGGYYGIIQDAEKLVKAARKHPEALFCASPNEGEDSMCWIGLPITTTEAQNYSGDLIEKKGKYWELKSEDLREVQTPSPKSRRSEKDQIRFDGKAFEVEQFLKLKDVKIEGNLNLSEIAIKSLPSGLKVGGDLNLYGCESLVSIPFDLQVGGDLYLERCTSLKSISPGLRVGGNLHLVRCKSLESLPSGLKVGGSLWLGGCTSLESLPSGLKVGSTLSLEGCTSLETLPSDLQVGGWLNLRNCTSLKSLPSGFKVNGVLNLSGCTSLKSLPSGLQVGGSLILSGFTSLKSLPSGLQVGGDLNLHGCTSLESLPSDLKVGGNLNLRGCKSLKSLPPDLKVGGDLDLVGCASLKSLPLDLKVKGKIHLPEHLKGLQLWTMYSP